MPTVAVKPELIRWAIDRSGVPIDQLRQTFPKLESWETGESHPTIRQLEKFARTTMTPFGAMFLDSPPQDKLQLPDFRTKNDLPVKRCSPNLLDTIQSMQQRQAWMREWLIDEGAVPLAFVGSGDTTMKVDDLAKRIRQQLCLADDWAEGLATWEDALVVLRTAIERAGVVVFRNSVVGLNNHRPLDPDEFRGFVICDPIVPLIFINDADSKSARNFTLAHELVHVWMGQNGVFNLEGMVPPTQKVERFCNLVAAEFLVPGDKLAAIWKDVRTAGSPFHILAKLFKVSPIVAARRLLDLALITKPAFFKFYNEDRAHWQSVKESQSSGGNFYATQNARLGKRFSAAVVRAAREGRLLYQDAFRLTGLKGQTFQAYADLVLKRVRDERE